MGALGAVSGFAGFLGPALQLGLAIAGVPSEVESLIKGGFAQINSKLDALAGQIDDLGQDASLYFSSPKRPPGVPPCARAALRARATSPQARPPPPGPRHAPPALPPPGPWRPPSLHSLPSQQIKDAISSELSLSEWGASAASARAISDKVREWLVEPASPAVLDRVKATRAGARWAAKGRSQHRWQNTAVQPALLANDAPCTGPASRKCATSWVQTRTLKSWWGC